ncbi:MAG: elongation factor 1-beta [Halobacteria archaeon]|nr:elongation factor 1-beta [Halobacteria archaeon]
MGKVVAAIKVMPTGAEVDLNQLEDDLKDALPESAEVSGTNREDVAFGLTALFVNVMIPDEEGGTQAVEDAFADVENVESVSVEDVGRA